MASRVFKPGNWFTNAAFVLGATKLFSQNGGYASVAVVDSGETIDPTVPVNLVDGAVTLPNGTFAGQTIFVSNTKAGNAVLTGAFDASNNTLTIASRGSGCHLVWTTNSGPGENESVWTILSPLDGTELALSAV